MSTGLDVKSRTWNQKNNQTKEYINFANNFVETECEGIPSIELPAPSSVVAFMKVVHSASLKATEEYEKLMSKYNIEREKYTIYYDEDNVPLEINSITEKIFNMKVS